MPDRNKYLLSVDLGTSNTVAALRRPDGSIELLLVDGAPIVPSGVFLAAPGELRAGRDAARLGRLHPAGFEPYPKRRIDETHLLLGGVEVPLADVLGAVLHTNAQAAIAQVGEVPPVVLTHPAAWAGPRQAIQRAAAERAGFAAVSLVAEPVAAARHFTHTLRRPVAAGRCLAVFDFGAGTLDIAVLRAGTAGPVVVSLGGATDLGGLDLDEAIVDYLGEALAESRPGLWQRLSRPESEADGRLRHQFWQDVRIAKETLSGAASVQIALPGDAADTVLTRDELEEIVGPLLDRAVRETERVIRAAGVEPRDLAGLFLVGGASRLPMVARLLHARLGIAPTLLEQPELPVAEGALATVPAAPECPESPAGPESPDGPDSPHGPGGVTAAGRGRRTVAALLRTTPRRAGKRAWIAAVVAVVLAAGAGLAFGLWPDRTSGQATAADATTASAPVNALLPQVGPGLVLPAGTTFTSTDREHAYYATASGTKLTLSAADLDDGQRHWGPRTLQSTRSGWVDQLVAGPYLVLVSAGTGPGFTAVVLDAATGTERWRLDAAETYRPGILQFTESMLVAAYPGERAVAGYMLASGAPRWRRAVQGTPSISPILTPPQLTRPAGWDGSLDTMELTGRRSVYVVTATGVTILDAATGRTLDTSPAAITHLGLDNQLYLVERAGSGSQVRRVDLDRPGSGRIVAHLARAEVRALALCGHGELCVLDQDKNDTASTEIAAIDVRESSEIWRRPAADAETLLTVGHQVLATSTAGASYLFDPAGRQLLAGADQQRLTARVSDTTLLQLADQPKPGQSGTVRLARVEAGTGRSTQLGELSGVFGASCSWSGHILTCPVRGQKGPTFTIWRFVAG